MTVGEALIAMLERFGVDTVFGIPGVHTVELYRGLSASGIRHITPRHEQGAAFMADGYARVSGKPGVCLLITGPGLTNAITAMAQARADSVPMLIISGVNPEATKGKGLGLLHELPDQTALSRRVSLKTFTLTDPARLGDVMRQAFETMTDGRPGPVHIEIPTDVMSMRAEAPSPPPPASGVEEPDSVTVERIAALCEDARAPLILAGGGIRRHAAALRSVAERLDAPVVTTVNARGVMARHALDVPASPSLAPIRDLIATSDFVLAVGTEMGRTDYDMYDEGAMPAHPNLARIDIDPAQASARDDQGPVLVADAGRALAALLPHLTATSRSGPARAGAARRAALASLPDDYRAQVAMLSEIWKAMPDAIIVGDSTQPVYAGNLVTFAPGAGRWFNSATGYGTLGYALPAGIGAALAAPDQPVVVLSGDGGLQFSLAELGSARDSAANVAVLVWNNAGYREIEAAMVADGVAPVGVTPSAPDFTAVAAAYGLPARAVTRIEDVAPALANLPRPGLLEYRCPREG